MHMQRMFLALESILTSFQRKQNSNMSGFFFFSENENADNSDKYQLMHLQL